MNYSIKFPGFRKGSRVRHTYTAAVGTVVSASDTNSSVRVKFDDVPDLTHGVARWDLELLGITLPPPALDNHAPRSSYRIL